MPESSLGKVAAVVGIVAGVAAVLGLVLTVVIWRYPHSTGLPKFEGALDSKDELAEFDRFIIEHDGQRVRIDVTFPDDSTIVAKDLEEAERHFVIGDIRCKPLRELCQDRFSYSVRRMRSDDAETVFGWGGAEKGYFLRGTYFVVGAGTQMGINWRTIQAVRDGVQAA